MKSIKDFEVKFVLSPLEEKEVISGEAGCACSVYGMHPTGVTDKLYVDGVPVRSHWWGDGDVCIQGLTNWTWA